MSLSRRSLRARLLATQLVLLAVVCLLIGVVTMLSMRSFLLGQLDTQLAQAADRGRVFAGGPRPPRPPGDLRPILDAPGQRDGTVSVLISGDGSILGARQLKPGTADAAMPGPAQVAEISTVPVDGEAHSRQIDGLGDFRFLAVRTPPGDLLVTGLPLADVDATLRTVTLVLGGITLIALVAAGSAGVLVLRRTLRPLDRIAETAGRVAELPLDRGEVALGIRVPDADPGTEVGQVGAALNRMLGHIGAALTARQASETRVRRFVADASHELRTPLASIRGYAEIAGRYADLPPEVAHAVRRVDSESRRMTTLVEDLLLLARLDAGRPVEREPVDLSRLVVETVGDARVAGPEHRWRLELPPEPVLVPGDQPRLHQALANLLTNARTHTGPGTTVTTSLSKEDSNLVLTVADDGPGVPGDLDVFGRFVRGDDSRSRAAGSTGLGLAIVAAVVQAHSGEVSVTSEPGATRFEIRLPAEQSLTGQTPLTR